VLQHHRRASADQLPRFLSLFLISSQFSVFSMIPILVFSFELTKHISRSCHLPKSLSASVPLSIALLPSIDTDIILSFSFSAIPKKVQRDALIKVRSKGQPLVVMSIEPVSCLLASRVRPVSHKSYLENLEREERRSDWGGTRRFGHLSRGSCREPAV